MQIPVRSPHPAAHISIPHAFLLWLGHIVVGTMLLGSFCTSHAFQGELRFHSNDRGQSVVMHSQLCCFEGGVAISVRSWEAELRTLAYDYSGMPIHITCCYRQAGQVEVMDAGEAKISQAKLQNNCFTLWRPSSIPLANGTCGFLSFFSISDYPLHSVCCSGANSSLARVGLRVPACDGWALTILECRTGSRHGVRRFHLPLHQQWTCGRATAGRLTWGCQQKVCLLYYINTSREPTVDIKFYFWMIFNKYTTSLLYH